MIVTKKKRSSENSIQALVRSLRSQHQWGYGLVVMIISLLALSLFSGINFDNKPKLFTAGTVADADVVASRELLVEDILATNARREQLRNAQPLVYDLSLSAYEDFSQKIMDILREINGLNLGVEYVAIKELENALTPEIAEEVLEQLASPTLQTYVSSHLLPMVRSILTDGLVTDMRAGRVGKGGVIIRVLETGEETLRHDVTTLPDVQSTLVQLSGVIRKDLALDELEKRALNILLSAFMPSSLSFNGPLTDERAEAIASDVDPVFYSLHRGEVIVRKGDVVTREQQTKLQTLHNSGGDWIQLRYSFGLFILSFLISAGLVIAPSGKAGTPLRNKDFLFMAFLLAGCTLVAKLVYILAVESGDSSNVSLLAYAFPVSGLVGIVAMVFAARRYCTISLLLALFTTIMFKGGIALFFYYFLGGMVATLLVTRTQSRQDVVWSIIPLSIMQLCFWLGVSLINQSPIQQYPMQMIGVICNSIASVFILFAFSPVLEMLFSYTTRFKLMEFMSLEHPLMQDMMVTMPGTYHHSLVVANMVEAAAKAIGANSLLCKVGALYHDVGKLSHPDYFIENQFGGRNKHDKLAPSMSALILTSHVKKGAELAESHKLGEEITALIAQHHGTRLISYFYHKAVTMGENVRESDYCYAGPRPQTKEAAILMLADSVEASSRTLTDPTPARLKTHIDKIVKGIFSEGQLDESALTFKDLHKISEQFLRILTGIFHQRIAYPAGNPKDPVKENGVNKEEKKSNGKEKAKAETEGTSMQDASATSSAMQGVEEAQASKENTKS